MNETFTLDGSALLERHLANVCAAVQKGVRAIVPAHKLEGLALAGGYGRGEGGVLRKATGDLPYNDLEFFVFIRGSTHLNDRLYRESLHQLGAGLSPEAGLDVEFKVLSLSKLRRSGPSMFYYDLVMGHRWLIGDDTCFEGCDHHRAASAIPLHEATRLLFNRCSGLFYSKVRLQAEVFKDHDADFVARNIAKARLALGDVWLAMQGSYHWSCRERLHRLRLNRNAWARRLSLQHEAGVAFKLSPQCAHAGQKEQLEAAHAEVSALAGALWLHLEGRRLGRTFRSVREYARSSQPLCPGNPIWRNAAANLLALGTRGMVSRFGIRYPRERLLRALSLLLWGGATAEEAAIISACLQCRSPRLEAVVQAYEKLWHRFN